MINDDREQEKVVMHGVRGHISFNFRECERTNETEDRIFFMESQEHGIGGFPDKDFAETRASFS